MRISAIINESYHTTIEQDEKMLYIRTGGEWAFMYYDRMFYDRTVDMIRLYKRTQIIGSLPVKWLTAS